MTSATSSWPRRLPTRWLPASRSTTCSPTSRRPSPTSPTSTPPGTRARSTSPTRSLRSTGEHRPGDTGDRRAPADRPDRGPPQHRADRLSGDRASRLELVHRHRPAGDRRRHPGVHRRCHVERGGVLQLHPGAARGGRLRRRGRAGLRRGERRRLSGLHGVRRRSLAVLGPGSMEGFQTRILEEIPMPSSSTPSTTR